MFRFDQRTFRVSIIGQFFFQPLQFHLESPNLLIQIGLQRFLLFLLPCCARTENAGPFLEQLALPFADLTGVQFVLAR